MIITKTPFRVSFAGGGSDMANFYEQHGGCVLSTSINKYCYLSIHPYFDENATLLKYSENELVTDISKIKHRIFNSVLNEYKVSGVEISSTADVPGGTGLGSSSTFTVGLLNTIACYRGKFMSKGELAAKACDVEINKLGSPIGKQDQYAAAYGGLNFIRFNQDGSVSVEPIVMQPGTYKELEKHLVMFYTGNTRSANSILKEQKKNIDDAAKAENLIWFTEEQQETTATCTQQFTAQRTILHCDLICFINHRIRNTRCQCTFQCPSIIQQFAKRRKIILFQRALHLFGQMTHEPEKQEQLRVALGLRRFDFSFERDGASVVYIGDR